MDSWRESETKFRKGMSVEKPLKDNGCWEICSVLRWDHGSWLDGQVGRKGLTQARI